MTAEEFEHKQKEMPTGELIELCEKEVSNLCKSGGKSIKMTVPPSVNDTDMLLCEALKRLKHYHKEQEKF